MRCGGAFFHLSVERDAVRWFCLSWCITLYLKLFVLFQNIASSLSAFYVILVVNKRGRPAFVNCNDDAESLAEQQ